MEEGYIQSYYGEGIGKTSAALGQALRCASSGGTVYMVLFLKSQMASEYYDRLEPEFKLFRFERSPAGYDDLTPEEREEEKKNLANGINFARKVLVTGECDMLVLDEVLSAVKEGMICEEDLVAALKQRSGSTRVILTGRHMSDAIREVVDSAQEIITRK